LDTWNEVNNVIRDKLIKINNYDYDECEIKNKLNKIKYFYTNKH